MKSARCLALVLLAGCASSPQPQWVHPSKDAMEYRSDLADCARFFGGSESEQLRCMNGKGWKLEKSRRG